MTLRPGMLVETPAEQLFFTTVRIEARSADSVSTGTSFVYNYSKENYQFLVSNRHVVEGADRGSFFFTKSKNGQPLLGERFTVVLNDFSHGWHFHPDPDIDIAVMPLGILDEIRKQGTEVFFRAIPSTICATPDQMREVDAIEDLIFIGYPNGMYDEVNLTPVARRGTTATPICLDYAGKKQFLIDASIFPGSSGSPVFLWNPVSYSNRRDIVVGSRILFLGVLSCVFVQPDSYAVEFVDIPTTSAPVARGRQLIDLGGVFRAETVNEAIESYLHKFHPDKAGLASV